MKKEKNKNPIQPVMGTKVPRFAGANTFARLPELRDVESCDVAIVGIPFDAGTSYRPGARFGTQSIRQASRHLRTNYHPNYDVDLSKFNKLLMPEILLVILLILMKPLNKSKMVHWNY